MRFQDLKVLSQEELQNIHLASLSLLENVGMTIYSEKAKDLLGKNGAKIGPEENRVRIPAALVESCLREVPKSFTIYDRDGVRSMNIGDGNPKCAAGHNATFMIDIESSLRRRATVKNVADFTKVCQALEDIEIVGVPAMPQDVNPRASLLYGVKSLYENTTKPIFFSTESVAVQRAIIEMMKITTGRNELTGYTNAISQLSPTSPLCWTAEPAEALIEAAVEGVPVNILPEPITGLTSPYSLAGTLTVHNTEILSGVVIAQLARKGTPLMYGASWTGYDMRFGNTLGGSPETDLLRIAGIQTAKHYEMPSQTTAPNSEAHLHDEQNAWEKAISAYSSLCAGVDIAMNSGMFAKGMTISLEQLILDHEMMGILKRIYKGIDVNADTIAEEVIANVGPRGNYITEEHTLENLHSGEFRENNISNRYNYADWLEKGQQDVAKVAADKAKAIIDAAKISLDPEINDRLDTVIQNFIKN